MEKYLLSILGSSVDYFYESDTYPVEGDFSHAVLWAFPQAAVRSMSEQSVPAKTIKSWVWTCWEKMMIRQSSFSMR